MDLLAAAGRRSLSGAVAALSCLLVAGATPQAEGRAHAAPLNAFPGHPDASASALSGQRIRVDVVYPEANALIASSDSNFIFGSVGNGRALLTINGAPVRVHPNGAFLAWLPLPPRGDQNYRIVAVLAADTVRVTHPVLLPPERPILSSDWPLAVDRESVTPLQPMILRGDEGVRVGIRAPANAEVFLVTEAFLRYLVNGAALPDLSFSPTTFDSSVARSYAGDSLRWSTSVLASDLTGTSVIGVARDGDTISVLLPQVTLSEEIGPLFGMLGPVATQVPDSDRAVVARPSPGGTYKWLLHPGTIVEITGKEGDFLRARFDEFLEVWIATADVQLMPRGFAPVRPRPGNSRLVSSQHWVDLIIPVGARVPYYVETLDDRLNLTLYGVRANLDNVPHPTSDTLVKAVTTFQEATDRARISLHLSERPLGYLVLWEHGNLILRVRRMPEIAGSAPLRGLTIAVDAGHPPAGATGPAGLYEGVATLQIARRLEAILQSRGAQVVMTRTDDEPVELGMRAVIARRAAAHAMVSIHLNALPDGINPFEAHGTATYYFQNASVPLARLVQEELLKRLRLRDLGVTYNTFAVTRPTYMPTILCEGAFIMIPEQEEAARAPEFQTAYATAVADGLERFFRALAQE
jgi:N-acetylmuramoyl-L-alanine amidase